MCKARVKHPEKGEGCVKCGLWTLEMLQPGLTTCSAVSSVGHLGKSLHPVETVFVHQLHEAVGRIQWLMSTKT